MVAAAGSPGAQPLVRRVWQALETVMDPEIPVVSIVDLGIVRHVRLGEEGRVHVGITPTYSGCPATELIHRSIREALFGQGLAGVVLETVLWPAWTTEWLSEEGRRKLEAYGIAVERTPLGRIACPRCASESVERLSEFGSTPCKAHYRCSACLEPFDTFKCI
jgi:ring-1,2-phenylacetyl-CoA epoxidase subunit PaaD